MTMRVCVYVVVLAVIAFVVVPSSAVEQNLHGCSGQSDSERYSHQTELSRHAHEKSHAQLSGQASARRNKLLGKKPHHGAASFVETGAAAVPCGHIGKMLSTLLKKTVTEVEEYKAVNSEKDWFVFLKLDIAGTKQCNIVHVTDGPPTADKASKKKLKTPPKVLATEGTWNLVEHRETVCPVKYKSTDKALQDVGSIVKLCLDNEGEDDVDFCRGVREHQKALFDKIKKSIVDNRKAKSSEALEVESAEMLGLPTDDQIPAEVKEALLNPKFTSLPKTSTQKKQDTAKKGFLETDAEVSNPTVKQGQALLWTNAVVRYYINTTSPGYLDTWHDVIIQRAIDDWAKATCVAFEKVKSTDGGNMVQFRSNTDPSCSSRIGMIGGTQPINLGRTPQASCTKGNAVHEIGHALGMHHTHSRSNRDGFLAINGSAVEDGKLHNFVKVNQAEFEDSPSNPFVFDWRSIMMYPLYAFSKRPNEWKTIVPDAFIDVSADLPFIGQRQALTPNDAEAVNRAYQCEHIPVTDASGVEVRVLYKKTQDIKFFKARVSDMFKVPVSQLVLQDHATGAELTTMATVAKVKLVTEFDRVFGTMTSIIPWRQKVCARVKTATADTCVHLNTAINYGTTLEGLTNIVLFMCFTPFDDIKLVGEDGTTLTANNMHWHIGHAKTLKVEQVASPEVDGYPGTCFQPPPPPVPIVHTIQAPASQPDPFAALYAEMKAGM